MHGDLETDHDVLVTLHRFTLATAEQLHQLHGGTAGIKQTQKRLTRLYADGLADFVTLPQAGRAKAWHLTTQGAAVAATFPEARRTDAQTLDGEQLAVRHGREHLLDVGRIHAAFVTDARTRGEACGPLDLLPARALPTGEGGGVYRPTAELAYTAGTGEERRRLRAFVERHRPGVGAEETAAQLAACARVWEQAGSDGRGRAWERRWRAFPRLLVVLVGTAAAGVRGAVADLRLAAEENPAVAEMLAAVPAGAARIEDLIQRGPSAPIWHPINGRGGRACGWTEL
ncbi:replication-relaxation family protein [Kitasatospora cathayae]|uniref:Replication-relaxation family protein n=1 Tax=Kitasatospora cathayae TaxID=3004092 RepID=A0ABY7QHJ7_9ACTN|nr:replication-relaxation family protein [Kitasatospora sp. HUAS 3-15]WBP91931.1 replication-relaxation family protein [Kitasatospora sp. HUAS 3-15]